jgi:ABC-type Co2+ transport system permease subunit
MTHIMVPDGVFPWWLSAAGWVAALTILLAATYRLRAVATTRMVPLVAVMTALMAVVMSVELVPLGYELHLTVLTGIVIGPWFGAIAALLFNVLRALVGDGAFTNIGLNTLVTWLELTLGALFFATLRPLARHSAALAASVATFLSLACSTIVFLGIVAVSTVDPVRVVESGAIQAQAGAAAGFGRFAVALLVLGTIGWAIEAVLTGGIVAFVARVRPGLLHLPVEGGTTDGAARAGKPAAAEEVAAPAQVAGERPPA